MNDMIGKTVRICHKKGCIVDEGRNYTAEVELGGVHQHVTLTKEYVEEVVDA